MMTNVYDYGLFIQSRIIDLSKFAAEEIDNINQWLVEGKIMSVNYLKLTKRTYEASDHRNLSNNRGLPVSSSKLGNQQ